MDLSSHTFTGWLIIVKHHIHKGGHDDTTGYRGGRVTVEKSQWREKWEMDGLHDIVCCLTLCINYCMGLSATLGLFSL